MKTNIKSLELIEKGMTAKTVSKLTESQVNILHSKLVVEQVTQQTTTTYNIPDSELTKGAAVPAPPAGKKMVIQKTPTGIKATPTDEMSEEEEVTLDPNKDTETQDPHQVGPSSDDGFGNETDGMGMFESEKKNKSNPYSICHSQVGPKKSRKWHRCVREVKKQLGEGKNPVSLFLENEIMKIVERNILPRITKGDLIKHLNEEENFATKHLQSFSVKSSPKVNQSEPAVAPTKPKTNPTTKPGTKPQKPAHPGKNPNPGENPAPKAKKKEVDEQNPSPAPTTKPAPTKPGTKNPPKQRPSHPGKNPNPGENPSPKAKKTSPEKAKNDVIDVIIKMLEK